MAYYPKDSGGSGNLATALGLFDQFFGLGHDAKKQALSATQQAMSQAAEEEARKASLHPGQKNLQGQAIDANTLQLDDLKQKQNLEKGASSLSQLPNLDLPQVFGLDAVNQAVNPALKAGYMKDHSTPFEQLPDDSKASYLQDYQKASGGAGRLPDLAQNWNQGVVALTGAVGDRKPKLTTVGPKGELQTSLEAPKDFTVQSLGNGFTRVGDSVVPTKETPGGMEEGVSKVANELFSKLNSEPTIQRFNQASASHDSLKEQVEASIKNPSGANDVSIIFAFMKSIDPGSTVREGEFATAQQTTGIPQAIIAQYNKALEGVRLTQPQREEFLKSSTLNMKGHMKAANTVRDTYVKQAANYGIPEKFVAEKFALPDLDAAPDVQSPPKFRTQAEADAAAQSGQIPPGTDILIATPEGWKRVPAGGGKPSAAVTPPVVNDPLQRGLSAAVSTLPFLNMPIRLGY